jgi:glycosyltransferase involved in cell wall biosynthesis
MKIVILNTQALFVRGGAEHLADGLKPILERYGHRVEIVRIPFKWYPEETIIKHVLACRMFKIQAGEPDLVIALKFPTYYIPFENKKLWLLHQFRQIYDFWGTPFQGVPDTPEGYRIRQMITNADNLYLPEAKAIYTNSRIVARRLKQYNNIDADAVLYPPVPNPEVFHTGPMGDYFFYPSRINETKRQALIIQAMRYVKSPFKLVLAGKPDSDAYGAQIDALIEREGVRDRVKLLGFISEEEKASVMANSLGVIYIPYDEDSYGYVTLEAFHSHKPVITCTDSGGTDEIMEHGRNGFISEPTPQALAEWMEALWADRNRAQEMGEEGWGTINRYNIRWDYIVENLTR